MYLDWWGFWWVCRADFSLDSAEDYHAIEANRSTTESMVFKTEPSDYNKAIWFSLFVQTFIHCVSCSFCGPWLQNFDEPYTELFSDPALQRGMSHWEIPCVPLLYCFVHKFKSILISLHTFPCSYSIELTNCPPQKKFSFMGIHSHPLSLFSFHAEAGKTALEICQLA